MDYCYISMVIKKVELLEHTHTSHMILHLMCVDCDNLIRDFVQ